MRKQERGVERYIMTIVLMIIEKVKQFLTLRLIFFRI